MKYLLCFVLFLFFRLQSESQTIKIMTYNLLAWSESNEDGRTAQMQKIFTAINPDIVVMQEVVEEAAINALRTSLNNRSYSMMEYKDIEDTECSCYYDPSLFAPISAKFIATTLRDISVYNLLELKTQDTFRIYTAHFKAADDEATQRAEEAQLMYDDLFQYMNRPKNHIVAAGDFNIYSQKNRHISFLLVLEHYQHGMTINEVGRETQRIISHIILKQREQIPTVLVAVV